METWKRHSRSSLLAHERYHDALQLSRSIFRLHDHESFDCCLHTTRTRPGSMLERRMRLYVHARPHSTDRRLISPTIPAVHQSRSHCYCSFSFRFHSIFPGRRRSRDRYWFKETLRICFSFLWDDSEGNELLERNRKGTVLFNINRILFSIHPPPRPRGVY